MLHTTGNPRSEQPYRLLAPGPVAVPPKVLRAMSEKVLHHRTPQFIAILNGVWMRLREFFGTTQLVQILTGSGSAAMEAAVVNTLSPGDETLVIVSGKFGERWAEMCEKMNAVTHRLNVPWGSTVNLEVFREALAMHPKVRVIFTQACETSTGTVHPVREMAALVRQLVPEALFAVDAITAVGCMPLPMDEWQLDVVIGGSQKAFMIPAGLSFIALSERAWLRQSQVTSRRYYFDLSEERKANAKGDSLFSIPTPLVVGLGLVLDQVELSGREKLWRRCATLSEVTRLFGQAVGCEIFSEAPSPSLTALRTPSDSGPIRDTLEHKYNITIMGGQDQLKGKILRVGHMGDIRNEDMLALFAGLGEILQAQAKYRAIEGDLERQLKLAEPLFS